MMAMKCAYLVAIFCGHLKYFVVFGIFCCHLVYFWYDVPTKKNLATLNSHIWICFQGYRLWQKQHI
jgi:hypothetical protein